MKLRIGLVGLGDVWQTRHAPALRTMSDRFEVRAVCDQVSHRAEQAAAEFDADAVDGYRTLAAREDIDAVLILSPQWYGALPILAACDSGKAVYCASGLDLEFEETQQVKQRIEESGIAFMAEFPRRHAPATIRLKELVATGLGPPRLVFCHQRSAAESSNHALPVRPPNHFSARHLVELVDWCCYVVDKPPRFVTGMMHRTGCDAAGDDYQMMSLDFSEPAHPGTGAIAQISCGRVHSRRLAGSDFLSPLADDASFLHEWSGLHRPAGQPGLVRRSRPAPGSARQRTPHRRAFAGALSARRHEPRSPQERSGRRLSRPANRPASPPGTPGRQADRTLEEGLGIRDWGLENESVLCSCSVQPPLPSLRSLTRDLQSRIPASQTLRCASSSATPSKKTTSNKFRRPCPGRKSSMPVKNESPRSFLPPISFADMPRRRSIGTASCGRDGCVGFNRRPPAWITASCRG